MKLRAALFLSITLFLLIGNLQSLNASVLEEPIWISKNTDGDAIHLYFFWSKKCPHCLEARPFILKLSQKYSWLIYHDKELTEFPQHLTEYRHMAAMFNQEARSVPAFFWCRKMTVGFDDVDHMGEYLEQQLQACYQEISNGYTGDIVFNTIDNAPEKFTLPLIGEVAAQQYSLPVYTILLASLDAFNPCAFFVLFFLLGLLAHAKNRQRMLLIGSTFVLISGVLYFTFMAAWLNVFLLIGQINLITVIAGSLAIGLASINIKDYFWFKRGISLSIPDQAKPGLFQGMRKLINADNLKTMMFATVTLAVFANTYELLCTAGFPLVYTRILTFNELPLFDYYLYLLFYNIIYMIPLMIIVLIFVKTLGSHKLQESHGRKLKLISGMMMLVLGLVLLIAPTWLNNIGIALLMFSLALLGSAIIIRLTERKPQENRNR